MANNNQKPTPSRKPSGRSVIERNRTINMIAICCAAAAVLIGLIIGAVFLFKERPVESTMNANVYIAGVNTYGMTREDAMSAVTLSAQQIYPKKTMVITVGNVQTELTPEITGATLDVQAAVHAAFNGSYVTNRHYIFDVTPYLNLDTDAIMDQLDTFSLHFGTPLTQTTYEVIGSLPDLTVADSGEPDRILQVVVGTPEYQLDIMLLYQQVLTSYSECVFQIEAECPKLEPDPLDLSSVLAEYFIAPVDATIDPETFQMSPERYGYTFDLDEAQEAVDNAAYGQILEFSFHRVTPAVTVQGMLTGMYQDVLGTYTAISDSDPDRDVNLDLACKSINGIVLYPGEIFSYNKALGERTEANGYRPGASYAGYETVYTIGGGICQVSSALYYCALLADLDIIERDCHTFAPEYMPVGIDAVINWGTLDFRFRNSSSSPIRIDAVADGGTVTVSIMGVDTKSYYVQIETEILKESPYHTIYPVIAPGNGYTDGQVISTPYTGYEVNTYRCKYSKLDDALISRELEDHSKYASRNEIIYKVEEEPPEPIIPEPTIPEVTVPEQTVPEQTTPEQTVPDVTIPDTTTA